MIIFTQHSLLKLKQRRIAKNLFIETLRKPDHAFKSYSDREIYYKKFKLYLKVIFKKGGKDIIVITQYWEKRPKMMK